MAELAREFEAAMVVGEEKAAAETRRWNRIGYAVIAATFGVSIVWSSLAPLSSAVVAQGSVKVDSSRKKIQHPEGGVVKAILVRDGSTVKAGGRPNSAATSAAGRRVAFLTKPAPQASSRGPAAAVKVDSATGSVPAGRSAVPPPSPSQRGPPAA